MSRCGDTGALVCDVVLQSGVLINGKLNGLINWLTELSMVLSGIDVVGVILWVVDVIFRSVASETLSGDLELLGSISAVLC